MPPVYVQPAAGPHRPLGSTPARRPGSARRTTTIDTCWTDSFAEPLLVEVRGRDLVTDDDGSARATAELALELRVDWATGAIVDIDGDAPVSLDGLHGVSVRAGYGRTLVATFPDGGAPRALWYSALEDLPGAFLVSGYAPLRAGLLPADASGSPERAARQADICIGWRTDGPVYGVLAEHGTSAVPVGPAAPAIEASDREGWHAIAPPAPGTVRRRRQVDVWPAEDPDSGLAVQSHFRDTYTGSDEPEMVMHEYLVDAAVDGDGRISAVAVDALVLPWRACPGAVASAPAVVGVTLDALGARVRAELHGPGTCTHLNSTLRALADVHALSDLLLPRRSEELGDHDHGH